MSYYRRGYNWEQVEYVPAPVGGWNPDTNPWEMPANQAPVLDNALIRPGAITVRGQFTNWADLSTSGLSPLNLTGAQLIPGQSALLLGSKAISATAIVDPVFAPISRPTAGSAIAQANVLMVVADGGTATVPLVATNTTAPGHSGVMYEGNRYYISYSGATVHDAGSQYFAAKTHLCMINSSSTITEMTNAPEGGLALESYQERLWMLGGLDSPGSGTTFSPLRLMFTNAPLPPGGGNTAAFADWKDPVAGTTNQINMDGDYYDPGIGLCTFRNALIVMRYNSIYRLTGSTTANYALLPVTRDLGCIDSRSIVESGEGIFFVSKQGLCLTDGVTVKNVSGSARHTLQNAISVVLTSIKSGLGGYITGAITDDGQILVSMGVPSLTSGVLDGHIQPVWCGMYDPSLNAWVRITSALWLNDAIQTVPGNTYPGWVMNTPDQRVLALGDKYITTLEAENGLANAPFAEPLNTGLGVADVAGVGAVPWTNTSRIAGLGPTNPGTPGSNFTSAPTTATATGVTSPGNGINDPTTIFGVTPTQTWATPQNLNSYISGLNAELVTTGIGTFVGDALRGQQFGFSIPADAYATQFSVNTLSWHQSGGSAVSAPGEMAICWGAPGSNYSSRLSTPTTGAAPFTGGAFTPTTNTWVLSGFSVAAASVNDVNFGAAWGAISTTLSGQSASMTLGVGGFTLDIWYIRTTHYLQANSFGFNVPSNATIAGIAVSIAKSDAVRMGVDAHVQLLKANAIVGNDHAAADKWSSAETVSHYGGSSTLWATSWAVSDINNFGFGVSLAVKPAAATNLGTTSWSPEVYYMAVTVYYVLSGSTAPQTFVQQSALYDVDQAGNLQPIPFAWTTRFIPMIGTTTLARKFGQIKRWFFDYVFQGSGLPSTNAFTITPTTSTLPPDAVQGTMEDPVVLATTAADMQASSVSGGQLIQSLPIERYNQDAQSEIGDLQFTITWQDVTQTTGPADVVAQCYGIGIEFQPTRDIRQ